MVSQLKGPGIECPIEEIDSVLVLVKKLNGSGDTIKVGQLFEHGVDTTGALAGAYPASELSPLEFYPLVFLELIVMIRLIACGTV